MSSNPYMIIFGVSEIILSQIPDFDQLWWLSIVAAVMSFTYSSIGLALGIATVVGSKQFNLNLTVLNKPTLFSFLNFKFLSMTQRQGVSKEV